MSETNYAPNGVALPASGDGAVRPWLEPFEVAGRIRIDAVPATARLILRGADDARRAVSAGVGFEVPAEPCRSASDGRRTALWLGPDEWLLLATADERDALQDQVATATGGVAHALIDVSDRQVGFDVTGDLAADVLNTGCPLDLDGRAFPVGACSRSVFGKLEVVLHRTGDTAFRVEAQRSLGAHLHAHLVHAARALTAS